jgi:hypothetical protein
MGMETELRTKDFMQAVLQALDINAVVQHVHIRQMVYVEGNGEMFTRETLIKCSLSTASIDKVEPV